MGAYFKLNGCTNEADEPHPFLAEAHAALCVLEAALTYDQEGPLNPEILVSATRGIRTLVHLAARGLEAMEGDHAKALSPVK